MKTFTVTCTPHDHPDSPEVSTVEAQDAYQAVAIAATNAWGGMWPTEPSAATWTVAVAS